MAPKRPVRSPWAAPARAGLRGLLALGLLGAFGVACAPTPGQPVAEASPSATPVPEAGSLAAALAQAAALPAGQAFDLTLTFGPELRLGWFALINGFSVVLEAQGKELASRPPALRVLPAYPDDFSQRPDAPASDGLRFANHVLLRFPTGDVAAARAVGDDLSTWGPIQAWAFAAGPAPQASPSPGP